MKDGHTRSCRSPCSTTLVMYVFVLITVQLASGGLIGSERFYTPPGGLDGYATGLGLMDVSSDEFYHDADERPTRKEGMPVEMKKMIANVETFHRQTLVNTDIQDRQDERDRAKEHALPEQRIPRKIWQVSFQEPLPKVIVAYSQTWESENEEYLHTLCTEDEARSIVQDSYPELLGAYDSLKEQSRQDLFMYMTLFKFGGVFASVDSTCELPLHKFVRSTDDLIVGHQPVLTSRVLQKQVVCACVRASVRPCVRASCVRACAFESWMCARALVLCVAR
jgi:hypothetical protein